VKIVLRFLHQNLALVIAEKARKSTNEAQSHWASDGQQRFRFGAGESRRVEKVAFGCAEP